MFQLKHGSSWGREGGTALPQWHTAQGPRLQHLPVSQGSGRREAGPQQQLWMGIRLGQGGVGQRGPSVLPVGGGAARKLGAPDRVTQQGRGQASPPCAPGLPPLHDRPQQSSGRAACLLTRHLGAMSWASCPATGCWNVLPSPGSAPHGPASRSRLQPAPQLPGSQPRRPVCRSSQGPAQAR